MQRTFSLNSPELAELVCAPADRPWIPNGALPREPRVWEREALRAQDVWGTSEHEEVEAGRKGRGDDGVRLTLL